MTLTRARTIQYVGILFSLLLIAAGYWYWSARAGVKLNTSASQPQGTGQLDSGLVGYWRLDETTGSTAADASTNGNNGTLVNMENGDWVTGQIGNGLDFDGSNEQITVPGANPIDIRSSLTLSTWAKFDTLPGNGESRAIFRKTAAGGANHLYTLRFTNLGASTYHLLFTPGGGGAFNYSDAFAATTGTWYLLTLTYDAGTDVITYYFNGVSVGTDTDTVIGGYAGGTGDLYIGSIGGSEYFDGQLDEMRIYDRALSPDEVAGLQRLTTPTSVDTSLKGYWSFNGSDISGTTAHDRSGAGNNGTLYGGPATVNGIAGQGLSFDGVDDNVRFLSNEPTITGALTTSFWIKTTATSVKKIFGFWSTTGWMVDVDADGSAPGKISFYSSNSGYKFANTAINDGAWHHVAITLDSGGSLTIYQDGIPNATYTSVPLPGSYTSDKFIGANPGGGQYFPGSLDEMRIYNRALSASEVKGLYDIAKPDATNSASSQAQGTGRLDSGLAGYWKLDDGSGTTAVDSSTNGNNGTFVNSPSWTTGRIGSGLTSFSTTTYVNVPHSAALNSLPFSLSFWVKTTDSGSRNIVIGKDYVDGYRCQVSGGAMRCWFITAGGGSWYDGGDGYSFGNVADDQWHLITMVISPSGGVGYVDGVQTVSQPWTGTPAAPTGTGALRLGTGSGGSPVNNFTGSLDEVRIYNRALSVDEVGQLYRLTSPTSVDTSLKGYWSFNGQDMTATTVFDQSGAGNNGTFNSAPVINRGIAGQALGFDGVDDYVTNSTFAWPGGSPVTVSFWNNAPGGGGNKSAFTIGNQTNATTDIFQAHAPDNTNTLYFDYGTNTNGRISTDYSNYINKWTHVVLVNNGTNFKAIYLNGVLAASGTTVATPPTAQTGIRIGAWPSQGYYHDGKIDEFRVYNRVLSEAEIKAQYDAATPDKTNSSVSTPQGTGRLDSGLAGYWPLDNGSGTAATDLSTNSNTGTLANGPTWTTGRIGGAVVFDGTDDYISTALTSLYQFGNQSFSVAGWFKRTSSSTGYILTQSSCSGGWGVLMGGGTLSAQIRGAGSCGTAPAQRSSSSTGLNDDSWHHFVVTFTTSTTVAATNDILIYIDGALNQGSVTKDGTTHVESTGNISIAAREIADTPFAGSLDEMRIYNRPLSAEEVSQLYRLNAPTGTDTSLKGYWSFNGQDVTATTAYDRSGSAINGTLAGNARAVRGKLGQALSLDGTGDYVNLGNTLELGLPMTVSGWINLSAYPASAGGILTTDKTNPGDHLHTGMWFQVNSTGVLGVNYGDNTNCNSGGRRSYTGTKVLALNTWYHVTAIVNGPTDMELYIDGAEDTGTYEGEGGAITYAAYSAAIGRTTDCPGGAGLDFPGKIDEVRIYNRALSATEVQTMYKQNK